MMTCSTKEHQYYTGEPHVAVRRYTHANTLVAKMPTAGEYHGNPQTIRCLDNFDITNRPTGLDDSRHTRCDSGLDTIGEWEERITG
jgi:hypothetical protein